MYKLGWQGKGRSCPVPKIFDLLSKHRNDNERQFTSVSTRWQPVVMDLNEVSMTFIEGDKSREKTATELGLRNLTLVFSVIRKNRRVGNDGMGALVRGLSESPYIPNSSTLVECGRNCDSDEDLLILGTAYTRERSLPKLGGDLA